MASEQRQIITGAQTGFQLRRLPVQSDGGQGQTHPKPVAVPTSKNKRPHYRSGMSDTEPNVPNRVTDSYREASALRPVTHETHTVASQKQLEGTRDIRKDYPHSQVTPPTSEMVTGGEQCAHRSAITPTKTCSANIYRCIKRRVGYSLKRVHCKGRLVPSRKQTTHKPSGTKSSILALKEFQDLCANNIVLIATDNTTVVAYINKEGGMKSGPLCALLWRILTRCSTKNHKKIIIIIIIKTVTCFLWEVYFFVWDRKEVQCAI